MRSISNRPLVAVMAGLVTALFLTVAGLLSETAAAESSNLTSTADTKLAENASTTNYGGATTIGVDGDEPEGSGKDAYSLLRWDLSSVPAGSRVDSVSVTLNVTNPSTQTYQAYNLKRAWGQSAATWLFAHDDDGADDRGDDGADDREDDLNDRDDDSDDNNRDDGAADDADDRDNDADDAREGDGREDDADDGRNDSDDADDRDEYASGSPWEVAGARGLLDRGEQVGSVSPSTMGKQTFTLSPALVQRWLDYPASNLGIVIANAANTDGFDFSSREAAEASLRPSLSVNYSPTTTTPPPTGTCTRGEFLAEYRNELRTFTTQPVLTRCETAINNDWGSGSPGSGVNADSFSARWVGTFDFEASDYEFAASADDGVRLWVDGQLLIDQWRDQGATTYKATRAMTAGVHQVRVKYYENGGQAVAKASWAKVASSPPDTGDPVLVGAGDIASGRNQDDEATARLLDGISGTVFTVGDNVYDSGTAAEFANYYEPTWGRHKARTKPTPGNHEYYTSGASAYFDYFGAAAGERDKGYYSYDVGEWHIVALNSNIARDAASTQVSWLKNDLAANTDKCEVAYMHHPRFSSGEHGSDSSMQPIWEALYAAGVDVVLAGHDHNYERFAQQTPSGALDTTNGIREFVVGTGGKELRPFGTITPNSEVRNADTSGVLKLTLHPSSYEWNFVPVAGQSFTDTGTTSCH